MSQLSEILLKATQALSSVTTVIYFSESRMGFYMTVSTDHNLLEEKGQPKRIRTEVPLLTSLMPYRWAKPAHRTGINDVELNVLGCQLTY